MTTSQPWPTSLDYDPATKSLRVAFDDDRMFDLPAEYLRVESPSAEVQGHNPAERQFVPGRMHVGIMNIEPVGHRTRCREADSAERIWAIANPRIRVTKNAVVQIRNRVRRRIRTIADEVLRKRSSSPRHIAR